MDELSMVVGAVLSTLTGGTLKMALAPTDAVAELWKERIKARLAKVGTKAERKQQGSLVQIDQGSSVQINERTAFKVLTEAAFVDDEVVAEYLAGVMAATPDHSDAGTPWLAQIGRLSSLQLRLHYIFYKAVWRFVHDNDIELKSPHQFVELFLPASTLAAGLEISDPVHSSAVTSSLEWLQREDLLHVKNFVERGQEVGRSAGRSTTHYRPPEDGIVLQITTRGVEFFLWGCGYPYYNARILRNLPAEVTEFDPPISFCPGYRLSDFPHYNDRERASQRDVGK